jgi:hypothetical protein
VHIALILLPAIAYILLILIYSIRWGIREISEALIKGHIVIFAFIAVSTEILSSIHQISFPTILIAWILFILVSFVMAVRRWRTHVFVLQVVEGVENPLKVISIGAIAFLLAATFATAILYPPNNWDSMTYHMSRVVHWISNNSASFYPTAITRQNTQMPLAEFAIMQVTVLTACDLYANLIQWMSYIVLICLSLSIAYELGLSSKQQLISTVVVATLPMAILQASSTQNDLVVSIFVMSFAFFMLRLSGKLSASNLIFAAISLGLALLTKGTAFLYCAAIGISLAFPVLLAHKNEFLKATAALSLVVIVALLLNSGHLWRNYQLYGQPLSTEGDGAFLLNEEMSASTLLSNLLRNGALHLGTPSVQITRYQERAIQLLLGSQLNNPKTTFENSIFQIPHGRHEDVAGNLFHMILALFGVALLPIIWWHGNHKRTIWYCAGLIFGTVLYCWILKWQPWAGRLHTPLFALASPLLAIIITSGGKRICFIIIFCMVLYSFPFALTNISRSLVSLEWIHKNRMQLYFQNRNELYNEYNSAMNVLRKINNEEIGLYIGANDWEYPFWVFARNNSSTITFKHVGVANGSNTINADNPLPLYVIATQPVVAWVHAPKYTTVYASEHVSVFRKIDHN